jgi:hypothetical protein
MRLWLATRTVRLLIVVIGISILTLEVARSALRLAIKWL